MTTPRKSWPESLEGERVELTTTAARLYNNIHITWEYGVNVPERNVAFCRTMLPQIKVIAKEMLRCTRSIAGQSSKTWPRTMIWALRDTKASLFQLITVVEMAERYLKAHNYAVMFDYVADALDYANEIMEYLEEYS